MTNVIDYTLVGEYEFMYMKDLLRRQAIHQYNQAKEYFSEVKHTLSLLEACEYRDSMEKLRKKIDEFEQWNKFNSDYLVVLNN